MAITVTALTVLGTAAPWKTGGSASAGTASALVAYGGGFNDGSNAAGGSGSDNSAYRYGQQHVSPAGETNPTTLAVTPGQVVLLKYISGTVASQGTGAGNSTPAGSVTTTLTPAPGGKTDSGGYVMPTDVIPGFRGFNGNGTVNTSGTAVTWVSGTTFSQKMVGLPIWINNAAFTVSSVTSPTALVLSATAGVQAGVAYFFYSAITSIGGLVGAFVDASGIIISGGTFDWLSWGGTTATGSYIALVAPAGAVTMNLGINDSLLRDNTGSFSMSAIQVDAGVGYLGTSISGVAAFKHFPAGQCYGGFSPDTQASLLTTAYLEGYSILQTPNGYCLVANYFGQLFPHGGQNSGGSPPGAGQNFPY